MSSLIHSAAPTTPPENLIATPLSSRTLHITWQPPVQDERNGIIRRYVINITELNSGNEYQLENASTEITVQDLHPFYRYSYSVAAETVALGPFTPGSIIEMPEDSKLIGACGKAGDFQFPFSYTQLIELHGASHIFTSFLCVIQHLQLHLKT